MSKLVNVMALLACAVPNAIAQVPTDPNPAGRPPAPSTPLPLSPSVPTPNDVYVSSFVNGLFKIPAGPLAATLVTPLPTGTNEDVCYDPISNTFVVSSDTGPGGGLVYRVNLSPLTVALIGNLSARDEIACDSTKQSAPGFSDILVASTDAAALRRYSGTGALVATLLTSATVVGGTAVGTIEAVGVDAFGTTLCGQGAIFVGTSSGTIALVPPAFTPVRLTSPAGAQFELAVDLVGSSPFDLATAQFFNPIFGYSITSCSAGGATNTLTSISPQFTSGDDFCFDTAGNLILPNQVGGTVDQIGTGSANPIGDRLVLSGAIPSPSGCAVITVLVVKIDLKPGSNPNCVNPDNRGNVTVAIFGSATFNVTTINQSTLRFGGAAPLRCHIEDALMEGPTGVFTTDGIPDLVCQFATSAVAWPAAGSNCGVVRLTGNLTSGAAFQGSDNACLAGESTCNAGTPIAVP